MESPSKVSKDLKFPGLRVIIWGYSPRCWGAQSSRQSRGKTRVGRSYLQEQEQIPHSTKWPARRKGAARPREEPGFAAVQRPGGLAAHAQRGPQVVNGAFCLPEFGAGRRAKEERVGPTGAGRGGAGGLARWARKWRRRRRRLGAANVGSARAVGNGLGGGGVGWARAGGGTLDSRAREPTQAGA